MNHPPQTHSKPIIVPLAIPPTPVPNETELDNDISTGSSTIPQSSSTADWEFSAPIIPITQSRHCSTHAEGTPPPSRLQRQLDAQNSSPSLKNLNRLSWGVDGTHSPQITTISSSQPTQNLPKLPKASTNEHMNDQDDHKDSSNIYTSSKDVSKDSEFAYKEKFSWK